MDGCSPKGGFATKGRDASDLGAKASQRQESSVGAGKTAWQRPGNPYVTRMSLIDRDLIMRQLRFLQQLLRWALKKQAQQDLPAALDTLREGYRQALGVPYDMLSRVDVASARLLLATPERRDAYAQILRAEAGVLRAQGDEHAALQAEQRAEQVTIA